MKRRNGLASTTDERLLNIDVQEMEALLAGARQTGSLQELRRFLVLVTGEEYLMGSLEEAERAVEGLAWDAFDALGRRILHQADSGNE